MVETTLGNIAEFINGRAFKPTEWEENGLPIIRIQNLNNPNKKFNYSNEIFEEKYSVKYNDLLFAWSASLGAHIWKGDKAWLNQHIFKVLPKSNINKLFLYYYLVYIIDDIYSKTHGSGMVHITLKSFKEIKIMLPSIVEQQRIVEIIEGLLEKLEKAKELAQNALDSFETRKVSILHKALIGQLTINWREQNKTNTVILDIETLKNTRLLQSQNTNEKKRINQIYNQLEENNNEELPGNWSYASLDKICASFQYGTSQKSIKQGEVAVIRMGNLQSGKIDWSDLAYTTDEKDINKYMLKNGDVLFNRTNSPELVGKTSIYEGEYPAIFAGYLIRINNYSIWLCP